MRNLIIEILTSKKALAAIAGLVITLAGKYGVNLPEETVNQILAVVISYIVGQGIADAGKEAAKVRQ